MRMVKLRSLCDGRGWQYQVNLSNNRADDESPASWSADGTKILINSNRDGNYEIYVMNLDGSGVTRLTDNPADDFSTDWQT